MDKNLVGKWHLVNAELEIIINIFEEDPPRMKVSFPETGYHNMTPSRVYEKDGRLCWEINEEANSMLFSAEHKDGAIVGTLLVTAYNVEYKDGEIAGKTVRFEKEMEVRFERDSDVPEDKDMEFFQPNYVAPAEPRIDILRRYTEYERGGEDIPSEFVLCGEKPSILDKYDYDSYVAGKSGDELAFALLSFVCDHFKHNGSNGLAQDRSVTGLIKFCERNDMATNCRGLAILLASLLRMNGIKARHVTCLPYEEPCNDCHVVVDCELPSGARVMMDPTYRLYLKDAKGEYVSLPRLREMLISGEEYYPNADAGYNGGAFDISGYREYMTKNTLRFQRSKLSADGYDDAGLIVELIPKDYPFGQFDFLAWEKNAFVTDDRKFWEM